MATLETRHRGSCNSVRIEIVTDHGDSFALKRPEFPITPIAEKGFTFLNDHLPEHPFLQQHFPKTEIIHDKEGAYYAQGLVQTNPGQENMASLSDPALFDWEQINSPEELADIVALMNSSLNLFRSSLDDPNSGLDPGIGWFLEAHSPDSYVRGRLSGDDREVIYFVDCHPMLPSTEQDLRAPVRNFYDTIDEIARAKFNTKLEDLRPAI